MDTNEIKLECMKLATEIMGPHPSTTYVQTNKQKFATDVLEEAKLIFGWVNDRIEEGIKMESFKEVGKTEVAPSSTIPPPPSPPLDKRYVPHGKP